jgi:hypothetical protein
VRSQLENKKKGRFPRGYALISKLDDGLIQVRLPPFILVSIAVPSQERMLQELKSRGADYNILLPNIYQYR